MSFFDEFNNIVPYSIKVNIGKNKSFKTDENKKSSSNHKGKVVEFYKRAETLEELEKYGLGNYIEYLPAEQVSMPIEIQVVSDECLIPLFEKTSRYTNKQKTNHKIRIFNSDKAQVGYVSLALTPSGDIEEKTSFYESDDRTEKIMHTTYNMMRDGKLIKDDVFEFQKNSSEGTKKVKVSQRDGKVVGSSVIEQDLENKEDVMFQPITQISKDENTPKLRKYVASCLDDETDYSKRGGSLIPWECMTLEDDLLEYKKSMDRFQKFARRFKEETGTELSIERAIEIGEMPYDELFKQGFPTNIKSVILSYSNLARYLNDRHNNLLKDFKGDYIGNILKLTDKGYEACIVTKHEKEGYEYRLYTLIDLTGTSITQGTGMEYMDIDRDPNYFKRLEEADKTPTFVTRIERDGNEKLVLYKGNSISGQCPEYTDFVEGFIAPLSEIKPVQINKILNKQVERDR